MTDADVDQIEAQLGVRMPGEYRAFVCAMPAAFARRYGGYEVFDDARFVINATRQMWLGGLGEVRVPAEYVVIGEPGTGDVICLDLSGGPAPVVEFDHERGRFREAAGSFGEWVWRLGKAIKA